jgi:transposase
LKVFPQAILLHAIVKKTQKTPPSDIALTPQQLFTWRRLARVEPTSDAPVMFVPAVVETPPPEPTAVVTSPHRARRRFTTSGIELEIGGVAVRVGADANPQAIAAVIRALKASS